MFSITDLVGVMNSADEKLVSRTLAGDRDAFGMLVHKYQEIVYSYTFQKVRNEADAHDITQEIFLQAYRCLYQLRQPHLFRSWLYTIMSNECKRWLVQVTKKRRREVAIEATADVALQVGPAHSAPVEGWQVDLEQAMSALPDENRVAVSMFYMGDCSLKEISEFLGVSVNTVKGKLYRARQQLGAAMSQHYGKLLKSHKLRGGFLMQFMEQIRHVPAPAMGFTWSSASIGKSSFALITALCILIGLVGGRANLPTESSVSQTEVVPVSSNRWPIEVTLLTPAINSARTSISGIPVPTGKLPLDSSRLHSTGMNGLSINRAGTSGATSERAPNPQLPSAMTENGPENLTFSGRVVDTNGEPVADAEILYSVKHNSSESVARTAGDGTFRFESPRLELKNWERVSIIATHPDHALGWRNLTPQNTADVEIRLETPGVISGRILNEDGAPIQNAVARIRFLFSGNLEAFGIGSGLIMDVIPISPVATDVNGEFAIRGLPQGSTTNLELQGQGYAKVERFSVPVGAEGLEFTLKREARIEGRVSYAETGESVQSARIAVASIDVLDGGWGKTSVDANGNYILKNLLPGVYTLYLDEGPAGWTAVAKEHIKIVEGQTVSNVDLTLIRGGFITGRVTDQDTNEPIANYAISLHDSARPESQASIHGAETDETGVYHFRAAPGEALIYTSAQHGYQDTGQIRKYVNVVEDETVVADFQFSKGIKLVGRTLTVAEEPVADAKITDARNWLKVYDKSNELGQFTVSGLRLGQELALNAAQIELGLHGTAVVEVQPGASIEIKMERYELVKVSGRVVNDKREPISLVNVSLTRWNSYSRMGYGRTVAVTDEDGWFRGIGLIVGDQYGISASAGGYRGSQTGTFVATKEKTQIADLVLWPASGGFFIKGRVTNTSGNPVRFARVAPTPRSGQWETFTDANGDYRLESLSTAVVIALEIYHPEYRRHKFRILQTNRRHDFVLVKADGYLAGKVVDTNGKPIERATVTIHPQEDAASGVFYSIIKTNEQGEFELKHIKDPIVSIYVTDNRDYKIFEDIEVNQRDLILTLTPTEPRPEPTPEQQARRKAQQAYAQEAEERFKTLVNQPAPALAIAQWLSGPSVSLENLRGKTIALFFWHVKDSDRVQWARLLNLLQEVYEEKGFMCVAICSAATELEKVKQYISKYSLAYAIGLDSPTDVLGARGETFDRYAVGWGAPVILINGAGEITGRVWDSELEEQIQTLLAD